jgi:hypothetical protein
MPGEKPVRMPLSSLPHATYNVPGESLLFSPKARKGGSAMKKVVIRECPV